VSTFGAVSCQAGLRALPAYLIQQKAYEPAAATVISFALTWACMGIINLFGRGQEGQIAGGH